MSAYEMRISGWSSDVCSSGLGNPGRPVFAGVLTEWVQESWLAASITLGERRIRSGALLLALAARLSYYGAGTQWVDTLRGISREDLTAHFDEITSGSPEVDLRGGGDTDRTSTRLKSSH